MSVRNIKDIKNSENASFGVQNVYLSEAASQNGINVPSGFVLSKAVGQDFLENKDLKKKIKDNFKLYKNLDDKNLSLLSSKVQKLIMGSSLNEENLSEIKKFYKKMSADKVLVRLDLIGDLKTKRMSLQGGMVKNIKNEKELVLAIKKVFAGLFSKESIKEREDRGVDHFGLETTVLVLDNNSQKSLSGFAYSYDLDSGFAGVVNIIEDDGGKCAVFKQGVERGYKSIFAKTKLKMDDNLVIGLTKAVLTLEKYFKNFIRVAYSIDLKTKKISISLVDLVDKKQIASLNILETYTLKHEGVALANGVGIGNRIGQGKVRVVKKFSDAKNFQKGEVLVTKMTTADWQEIIKLASAVVVEDGGKNSHAAIIARELKVPCLVGVKKATEILKNNQLVTVEASMAGGGKVYKGSLPFTVEKNELKPYLATKTKLFLNVGHPDSAYHLAALNSDGVGLVRGEFVALHIGKIESEIWSDAIAKIASAFYDKTVMYRLADFRGEEYEMFLSKLKIKKGDSHGVARLLEDGYREVLKKECAAIKKARDIYGLKNIQLLLPFCRTVAEAKKILALLKEFGLERGKDDLKVHMMCEVPANIVLAKDFSEYFDGFSIGTNDLTDLTLGVDRNFSNHNIGYDENNAAVKSLMRQLIQVAHKNKKTVSVCGQVASDNLAFVEFLIQEGVDSLSVNADSFIKIRERLGLMEKRTGQVKNKLFKAALAVRSLLVFGVLGLTSILGGYGCQAINNQTVAEQIKTEVSEQTLAIKAQVREELRNEMIKNAPPSEYSTDSFMKLKLKYPGGWSTDSWEDGVKFSSADDSQYLMIFYQKMGHPVEESKISTTTFMDYPAKRLTDASQKDGTPYQVLEIYPEGYDKTKEIIELRGDPNTFENSLKQIELLQIKK